MTQPKQKTQERAALARKRLLPIVESIGQAAAALGCSEALIKAAKRRKCPDAFLAGNRVDLSVLSPFLWKMREEANDIPEGFASWKEVLESEKAKREAIKRQCDEKAMMPTADAKRQATEACSFLYDKTQELRRELPPSLAGTTAVDAAKVLGDAIDRFWAEARHKFEEVGE